ncbi:MAG TPA: hypothetical protein VFN65_05655 [Solirubrobacteraceae bacterium]|nr:hypothetical protein [Solirubrobacteraceae bacterium]
MFQATKKRLQRLLDVVDDMLVGAPEEDMEIAAPHPHVRTVQLRIERRAGTVAPRPAHCLSPLPRPAVRRSRDLVR